MEMTQSERTHQIAMRGTDKECYQLYRDCADDGTGKDITRPGQPLKTFDEWMNS